MYHCGIRLIIDLQWIVVVIQLGEWTEHYWNSRKLITEQTLLLIKYTYGIDLFLIIFLFNWNT